MAQLLIAIIYLAFISLGLPDSLLGTGWPAMRPELGAPLAAAGIISMIISASTVVSALLSDRMARRFGTGRVTAVSVFLTAGAMAAFSVSRATWQLCLLAVPYGLGAGAIDACLNNYVALHLSSRHMSWLHCCWGIGATLSPYIMGACLSGTWGWRGGYRTVAGIQLVLAVVMLAALPLWNRAQTPAEKAQAAQTAPPLTLPQIFRLPAVKPMLFGFLSYCALETLPIVWSSSYYVAIYDLPRERAAFFASLFYIGMTAGRALNGFFADRIGDRMAIRGGLLLILAGLPFVLLPLRSYWPALIGFLLVGLGCAPIYPAFVHSVPALFGRERSQSVIGVQMAFAYLGMTFSPPLFGQLAQRTSIRLLPFCMLGLTLLILLLTARMHAVLKAQPSE